MRFNRFNFFKAEFEISMIHETSYVASKQKKDGPTLILKLLPKQAKQESKKIHTMLQYVNAVKNNLPGINYMDHFAELGPITDASSSSWGASNTPVNNYKHQASSSNDDELEFTFRFFKCQKNYLFVGHHKETWFQKCTKSQGATVLRCVRKGLRIFQMRTSSYKFRFRYRPILGFR